MKRQEAANVIRSLVDYIEVSPGEGRGNYEVTLFGALSEILNLPFRKPGELLNTAMKVALLRYQIP